jgi:hypothetical protein
VGLVHMVAEVVAVRALDSVASVTANFSGGIQNLPTFRKPQCLVFTKQKIDTAKKA